MTESSSPPESGQELPEERPESHFLVQAPVAALDVDGLNVVTIGLVLFGVASILAAIFHPQLAARGDGWWLWVAVSGFVLGLFGLLYCIRRRRRRLKSSRG